MELHDWVPPSERVAAAVNDLRADIVGVLGPRILALYLSGSAVLGDFDEGLSDLDLLAVTASQLAQAEVDALQAMHEVYARTHPQWIDKVEVVYVSAADLREFRTAHPAFPVISPGEPFHLREDPLADWAANWYLIRQASISLLGPPARELLPEVSEQEFVACLRRYLDELRQRATQPVSSGLESYIVLTACRALHVNAVGSQASKRAAGQWATSEYREWAGLIEQALAWRYAERSGPRPALEATHALAIT